jgi:Predicted membrane protein (DUF2306)
VTKPSHYTDSAVDYLAGIRSPVRSIDRGPRRENHREQPIAYLLSALKLAAAATLIKVFLTLLYDYRWYFPADFRAPFLVDRRETFVGLYRVAFYGHLLSCPLAVVAGPLLLWSSSRRATHSIHRWIGRATVIVTLSLIVPSGLVMATQAHAGSIAGSGFASLAILTALCACQTWRHARQRRFNIHRAWATRLLILIYSPFLLRIMVGIVITLGVESLWTYRAIAWLSWLLPLTLFEAVRHRWIDERYVDRSTSSIPTRLIRPSP